MPNGIWVAIGSLLALILGVWKYYSSKRREKKKQVDEAGALFEEGMREKDESKINAALGRLNRLGN